jgi:hypothetical protein
MSHRTSKLERDPRKALGCVVYHMHLLAATRLLRSDPRTSGLTFSLPRHKKYYQALQLQGAQLRSG